MAKLGGFQFFSPKIRQDQGNGNSRSGTGRSSQVLEGEVFQNQAKFVQIQ